MVREKGYLLERILIGSLSYGTTRRKNPFCLRAPVKFATDGLLRHFYNHLMKISKPKAIHSLSHVRRVNTQLPTQLGQHAPTVGMKR